MHCIIIIILNVCAKGKVSWLAFSTAGWGVLCILYMYLDKAFTTHSTSLHPGVYMDGGYPQMLSWRVPYDWVASHPWEETLLVTWCYRNRDKPWLYGLLGSTQTQKRLLPKNIICHLCVYCLQIRIHVCHIPPETNHKIHVRLEFNFTSNLKCLSKGNKMYTKRDLFANDSILHLPSTWIPFKKTC